MQRVVLLGLGLQLGAAVLGGCGGPLAQGEAQFKAGRYPDAKQSLASIEADAERWPLAARAEYALYRGLTLGALGDTARAARWLEHARSLEAAHPGSLSEDDARRLDVARATIAAE
jgi:hypothetical protein